MKSKDLQFDGHRHVLYSEASKIISNIVTA